MMSVDILPTALPLDASQHFSKEFYPYLRALIDNVKTQPTANEWMGTDDKHGKLTEALERATIASGGKLRKKHQWLQPPVDRWHQELRGVKALKTSASTVSETVPNTAGAGRKKRMLMFGSGMVAGPAVQEIAKRGDVELVIGT